MQTVTKVNVSEDDLLEHTHISLMLSMEFHLTQQHTGLHAVGREGRLVKWSVAIFDGTTKVKIAPLSGTVACKHLCRIEGKECYITMCRC